MFADLEIASGSKTEWSYPSWPSHLDHILITNELFDEFKRETSIISTIKVDEYVGDNWWVYDNNISDHRPVAIKLHFDLNTGLADFSATKPSFSNYPNPFNPETSFSFNLKNAGNVSLKIYNVNGALVEVLEAGNRPAGENRIAWNAAGKASGIYFSVLEVNGKTFNKTKCLLIK